MATTTIDAQDSKTGIQPSKGILGVVAGEGKLPSILIKAAIRQGYKVVALALSEDAYAHVSPLVEKTHLLAPGQLGKNLKIIKGEKAEMVVFIGKVPKINLLQNITKLDWTAIRELSRLTDFNDDTIQRAMGDFCESQGLKVLTQSQFLRELFPDVGAITNRQPSADEYADIEFGKRVAKEVARLDIGQTVVVKDQMILAVEAIEGTDEAIKRAVSLAKGPVVVVKVAKQGHDERFDTPAVGMTTLQAMLSPNKKGGILAVAAHETMLVEKEAMVAFAEANGISIVAV